ncbi:GNAT family N-acetyltransferase [Streptomyces rubiginosohelvolus]|uniref:GNAT family N-acetyltransferase n=1 Tax=Streptomyces rubiginosohelvolus TaxID=67362 RepID=UPI00343E57D3
MLRTRNISASDYAAVHALLNGADLATPGAYHPEGLGVVLAEDDGVVIGAVEFGVDTDFGRDEGRPGHLGPQTWVFSLAVAGAHRRRGVGQALLAEVARRAQEDGNTYLALAPADGDDEADRHAFFRMCGLKQIEHDVPCAAWGGPVSEVLAATTTDEGRCARSACRTATSCTEVSV